MRTVSIFKNGKKGAPRHAQLVDAFCARLDAILPWDRAAVDATTEIKATLAAAGTPLGPNDTAIAGHALAAGAVLVTNNTRSLNGYRVLRWKTGLMNCWQSVDMLKAH